MNGRKVLENAVRSNFCETRCAIVPPSSSMPSLSLSDLCRSICRLTKQVVTTGTADPCMSLSTGRSVAARKRATFISPVWSRSSKSSTRVSLLYRAPPTQSLKHFLAHTQTHIHTPTYTEWFRNLSCFRFSARILVKSLTKS